MKKFTRFFLFLTFILPGISYAQKDSPVSGDAATLADLLKKDYNAMDADIRQEEFSKDRTLVIAIFKSYLSDDDRRRYLTSSDYAGANSLNALLLDYNKYKKQLATITALAPNASTNTLYTTTTQLSQVNDTFETAKKKYYKKKYDLDSIQLRSLQNCYGRIIENRYISYVIDEFIRKNKTISCGTTDYFAVANSTSTVQKSLPFLGGNLDFSTAIDGLAKFLAKRLKEELTTYVIEKVKVWLQNPRADDPFAEFKAILPQTTKYLVGFTANKITNFPNEIKQYIEDDLNHIITNAPNLRGTPRFQRLISNHPDLDFAFEALEIIPALSKVKTPLDYFTILENSKNLATWKTYGDPLKHNIANTIYMGGLIARSMVVVSNGELKIANMDFYSTYATDLNFYLLYTGFLTQQNEKYYDISFNMATRNFSLSDQLFTIVGKNPATFATIANDKEFIQGTITKAVKSAEKIYTISSDIKKANQAGKKIDADTIFNFAESIIDFSQDMVGSVDTLMKKFVADYNALPTTTAATSFSNFDLRERTAPYFSLAHTSTEVFQDMHHKKYATGLVKILDISSTLVSTNNQFSTVLATLQKLGHVQYDVNADAWKTVIDSIIHHKPGTRMIYSPKLKDAMKVLSGDIRQLYVFEHINHPARLGQLIVSLSFFDNIYSAVISGRPLTRADTDTLGNLVRNRLFPRLLISYCTNTYFSSIFTTINTELPTYTVNTGTSGSVRLFTTTEINRITDAIDSYINELYTNYFVQGRKNKSDALINAETQVIQVVTGYLSMLPQKFDIGANPKLVSLINFVNDMAVSNNSDDVEKAIEAFALPSGSYSIKRVSEFNFAINSYPGVLPAIESTWKNGSRANSFSIGFTAPVGFSLSWGDKRENADGIFLPIIDIGALTRLRLNSSADSTSTLPEFTFKNILAPGIYYSHGFRKTPLSINVGFQYGPQFQEITKDATGALVAKYFDSVRFGIALVFDLPLFNLSTKPR